MRSPANSVRCPDRDRQRAPHPAVTRPRETGGRRMSLHLLVVEGNTRDDRDAYRAGLGMTASET
ncbi:MAG TPA: hypothetical protein VGL41_13135, partial [Roseiarcus sp.]